MTKDGRERLCLGRAVVDMVTKQENLAQVQEVLQEKRPRSAVAATINAKLVEDADLSVVDDI